jgi:hypothetical protein
MILISGELIDKYNLSDINIKRFIPAEKDPNNINTFVVSAEKWFLIKIPEEEYTSQKLNELIEEYLKNGGENK